MFSRILAIGIIIVVSYTTAVFTIPDIADIYGNKSWNDTLRSLKVRLDTDNAKFGSGMSLSERAGNIAKPYIEETQAVTKQVKETVGTKTEQIKQAAESVQKAYTAVE